MNTPDYMYIGLHHIKLVLCAAHTLHGLHVHPAVACVLEANALAL